MAHENIRYEERAVGWTDKKLAVAISAVNTLQRGAHTNTRKTVTSMLMKASSDQSLPGDDEKGYLVSRPTLTTRKVSLVMRPPSLMQLVGASLPL